ncbi:MAG: hypothetical protein ABSC94_32460 [Polyangiaceae bacterium]
MTDGDFEPGTEAQRRDLSRRLHAWGSIAVDRLRTAGLEGVAPMVEPSGGRLLFANEPGAVLALVIEPEHVRAGIEVPKGEARAIRAVLADAARALELIDALEALPEQFVVGLAPDAQLQAPRCTTDDVRGLLDQVEREPGSLWIGWSVPRAVVTAHATLLDEQLEDALVALARVFLLFLTPGTRFEPRPQRGRGGSHRKRAARSEDERDRKKPRRLPDEGREHRPFRGKDPRDPETDREGEGSPGAAEARAPLRLVPRRFASRAKADTRHSVERGARVRVLEGPFSGKVGVVHELDGKGGARVMLGLLAVRLDVKNLAAEGEGRRRPVLSTSHRKPLPVRS